MSFSVSDTGLSPAMAELSSSLLLPNPESRMPVLQPRAVETVRFRLFPFRSPLLGESRLISFPPGTEMFHFPGWAPSVLCIQTEVLRHDPQWVSPFRHHRIKGCLAPPRCLSQLTTSFFASQRQGIRLLLFVSCYSRRTFLPNPYSIVNVDGIFRCPPERLPVRYPAASSRIHSRAAAWWR